MNDSDINIDVKLNFWQANKFLILIFASILISILLIIFSMFLYNISGAEQLDLSRPGYINVRSEAVDSSSEFKNYSETGIVDQAAIDEFKTLFDDQASKIKLADPFKGDPLNLDNLIVDNLSN